MIFALLASFLWIVVSVYSIGYMRSLKEHAQTRFYFCFAMALFGAAGVALSGNLLTLYMFYEILTVATFPLVAHKETPEALRAGAKVPGLPPDRRRLRPLFAWLRPIT